MIFTFLSYTGGVLSIIGLLLIVLGFILVGDEGPYKPSKRVLFGDSFNNLLAGMVIGIIGFFMSCIPDSFFTH